ncbi:putative ATP-grasp-modified RiPP [Nonomuraea sp. NPDC003804]|uniref:putative ATP-grasp-modified RiPP n=1 Tax=Nonomuraea sp. NPDC003804 TaxID=3154547 RepID=UPI0033B3F15D
MNKATTLLRQPWGLGRATERLPEAALPYTTTSLDPASQLTVFYDGRGGIVDMGKGSTNRAYATITKSRPGDGSQNAPNVADDSNNDVERD